MMEMDDFVLDKMHTAFSTILECLGANLEDENFRDTPKRIVKSLREILRWQNEKQLQEYVKKILETSFPTTYKGVVAQKDIKATSMCPHHMQPIHYVVDIGYVANERALGLSKMVRLVEAMPARFELQESFTQRLGLAFYKGLKTKGVMVIVKGSHGCMENRGVKQDIITTTSSVFGIFEEDIALRQEFLTLNGN